MPHTGSHEDQCLHQPCVQLECSLSLFSTHSNSISLLALHNKIDKPTPGQNSSHYCILPCSSSFATKLTTHEHSPCSRMLASMSRAVLWCCCQVLLVPPLLLTANACLLYCLLYCLFRTCQALVHHQRWQQDFGLWRITYSPSSIWHLVSSTICTLLLSMLPLSLLPSLLPPA